MILIYRYSIVTYLLMMMTSWAIVVDVWYLPPMTLQKVSQEVITILLYKFSGRKLD